MGASQTKSVTKEVHISETNLDKIYNIYVKSPEKFQNNKNNIINYNIQNITNIIIIYFLILFIILSIFLIYSKIIYK
jgi:hypothetical protein